MRCALETDGFRVTAAVTLLANGTMVDDHRPEIAILLQTGFSDLDTGDFLLLRKPYPPDELSARLRAIVADDCAWTERCRKPPS
jgi:hypothetical protein